MLKFCVMGAGRIGKIHASNIKEHKQAKVDYVFDPDLATAADLAESVGAKAARSTEEALADSNVNAVVIASPTNTHVDLIIAAARARKAIFCEKPIDLDIARVNEALTEVEKAGVPFFVAFNRRFDPSFMSLNTELRSGKVGKLEMVLITSRDPSPPPASYVKVSGGLFRDMMIHDFDMARWLLAEEPIEVFAVASCLVDKSIGDAGDVDTAVVVLKTKSGAIAQINNSRRAAYGYDQRIEVLGSKGMLRAENHTPTTVSRWGAEGVWQDKPLHFFLERYMPAYRAELEHFVSAVEKKEALSGAEDGRRALLLADAATESAKRGTPIKL